MIRSLLAAAVLVATIAPAGVALADPGDISKPAEVLQSAARSGNRVSTVPTPAPPAPQPANEMRQVLDLVNAERTSRGLVPLTLSTKLNDAALAHTRKQAADGAIYHIDPDDGSNPGVRISRTGYEFSTWGENVAAGYKTAQEVMAGWMKSPGHCRNILNPAVTQIGVAFVTGGQTYNQFWTQVFARPAGVPSPAGTYNSAWC